MMATITSKNNRVKHVPPYKGARGISFKIKPDICLATTYYYSSYNNQGLVYTQNLQEGDNSVQINVSNLTSGLYIVAIEVDGNVVANANLIVIH